MWSHNVHSLNVPALCFVFDLMMAQWTETCRRTFNISYQYTLCFIDWINYYIIAKHNGMIPIKTNIYSCCSVVKWHTIIPLLCQQNPAAYQSWWKKSVDRNKLSVAGRHIYEVRRDGIFPRSSSSSICNLIQTFFIHFTLHQHWLKSN
jgi:hypothetical protein